MSKNKKHQAGRDDAVQKNASSSHEEVLALIKERRKYVDWIRALEAKKEQTSPQAYERVHADYEARLDAVADKLAAHRDTLSAEQANLERKLSQLNEELQQQQDDRAETELRAHVGELTAAALTEALRVADTEIDRLTAKRNAVEKDLSRIAEFFAAADGTTPAAAPASKPAAKPGFDEMSFLNSVVGPQPAPVRPSQEKPRVSEEKPRVSEERPRTSEEKLRVSIESKPVAPAAEMPPPLKPVEVPATPPAEVPPPPPPVPPAAPTPPTPPTPTPTPTQPTPTPTRSSAETVQADGVVEKAVELEAPKPVSRPSIAMHMASLTIDPDAKPVVRDTLGIIKTGDELPPSILSDLQPGREGDKPLAANVASNSPLKLKGNTPSDLKTLKCRECGTMNDPSEWYCEKCGAELSAI